MFSPLLNRLAPLLLLAGCVTAELDPAKLTAARAAEQRRDWPSAILHWGDIQRFHRGQDAEASAGLAHALLENGSPEAARRVLARALVVNPEEPDLWQLEGEVALAQDRVPAALRAWHQALVLDPTRRDLVRRLAVVALEAGQPARIVEHVDPASWPEDERAEAHLLLARALGPAHPQRLAHYRSAFAGGAGGGADLLAAAELALGGIRGADLAEARGWLQELVASSPQDSAAHRALAEVQLGLGDLPQAEASALRYAELEPDEPRASALLASIVYERGGREDARRWLARARDLGPDDLLKAYLDGLEETWNAAEEEAAEAEAGDAEGEVEREAEEVEVEEDGEA